MRCRSTKVSGSEAAPDAKAAENQTRKTGWHEGMWVRAMRRFISRAFIALGNRLQPVMETEPTSESLAPPTPAPQHTHYLISDRSYGALIERVKPFTMTSYERIAALVDAIRYVVRAGIPGAIAECGVWRGGSMMAVALTLLEEEEIRDLYLFDTFQGMTPPTEHDVDHEGVPAHELYKQFKASDEGWCFASYEDVRENVLSTGYPENRIHFVRGDVLQTLPDPGMGDLAILRLDTDWYESTMHELTHLYPRLRAGGILIIDDFGYWQGCRKAVQEFFGRSGPFMSIIDQTGRLLVKPGRAAFDCSAPRLGRNIVEQTG
jgi:O-methyltransferase